jgi:hypothetical protein
MLAKVAAFCSEVFTLTKNIAQSAVYQDSKMNGGKSSL